MPLTIMEKSKRDANLANHSLGSLSPESTRVSDNCLLGFVFLLAAAVYPFYEAT